MFRKSANLFNVCKALVLDIDGVVMRGWPNAIPRAKEALHLIKRKNIPFLFLTNNGGELEATKANELSKIFEMEIDERQVILSHSPMRDLLPKYGNEHVLIVGGKQSPKVAKLYGFKKSIGVDEYAKKVPAIYPRNMFPYSKDNLVGREKFAAIFVMHDPRDVGQDLQICIDILRSNGLPGIEKSKSKQDVQIFFSNPDLLYADAYPWPRFGQGAFISCLSALFKEMQGYDLEYVQYGKPMRITYEFAQKKIFEIASQLGYKHIDTIFGIGDNPAADIRGANSAGHLWKSVLTRTGVFTGKGNDIHDPADIVVDDIFEFVTKFL